MKKGIKIIRTVEEDGGEGARVYYEAQDSYIDRNIDHIPASLLQKLYGFRLSDSDKERAHKIF